MDLSLISPSRSRAPVATKACPLVLRISDGVEQVLAFKHPLAGCQLVKGTIEAGELPAAAAVREPCHAVFQAALEQIRQRLYS